MPLKTVVGVGIIQCLSMIPGVSRSGATILGGLSLGVDYPLQRASEGSSQGIRFRLMQALDGKSVRRPAVVRATEAEASGAQHHDSSDIRFDFGWTYDDNVTRVTNVRPVWRMEPVTSQHPSVGNTRAVAWKPARP